MADKTKTPVLTIGRGTIDQLVETAKNTPPLNEGDYAELFAAMRDPEKRAKAEAWAKGNMSAQELTAYSNYARAHLDPNSRVDSNVLTIGRVGVAPEDMLGAGMAAQGVASAVKAGGAMGGLGRLALEAAPIAKYEALHHAGRAIGLPDAVTIPAAMYLSGKGGKGHGGAAETKVPPTLDEQLGVSSKSTGATMSTLPETPVPASGRTPMALEFGAARRTEALDAARAAAQELGVASDVTSPNNPPPAVGLQDAPALPSPAARERILVPQRLREPDPLPAPKPAKLPNPKQALIDAAREMGLNPDIMSSHTLPGVAEDLAATTAHGARMAELSSPTSELGLQQIVGADLPLSGIVPGGHGARAPELDPATKQALIEQLLKSSSFQGLVK